MVVSLDSSMLFGILPMSACYGSLTPSSFFSFCLRLQGDYFLDFADGLSNYQLVYIRMESEDS